MVITTREQRVALKRRYDYDPLYINTSNRVTSRDHDGMVHNYGPISYREFRKRAQPTFGCDNAIVIDWCGMWLCIERDGYTHS